MRRNKLSISYFFQNGSSSRRLTQPNIGITNERNIRHKKLKNKTQSYL